MTSSEGGDEGEAVATLAPSDDRLLLLVPVLDFVSAELDVGATVACLNRAFRKEINVFRAAVDDVGTIARLRGVGGGRRNYVEGHPHDGRVEGPLADTAFMLVTRFYTGLVRLDLRECLVTKPLFLLLPDACPNLEYLMVHEIDKDTTAADSWAWEHNANMWGPDRVCSLTVKRLQLRMPKLRVVAYVDFFVLSHPTGSNGAPHEGFYVVAHARVCAICRRKLPADAEVFFRGRRIRDDETFRGLRAQLHETYGDSWIVPLEIHVRYAPPPEEPQPPNEQPPEEPQSPFSTLLQEVFGPRAPNQVDGRRRRDWQPQQS